MAAPLISHLSCCLRSPEDRRQLRACRTTNDTQNTGRATAKTVSSSTTPGGLGCLMSWPAPFTATGSR